MGTQDIVIKFQSPALPLESPRMLNKHFGKLEFGQIYKKQQQILH